MPAGDVHRSSSTGANAHCTAARQALHGSQLQDGGGSAMIREKLDDIRFIATLAVVAMKRMS
ncbi:hypothetical protein, partial [Methylobacterium indicum]|uniref:hypothetical protein n=1 Tax=Methylobacterium indicum TaxID=1775910 RepID=UPI001A957F85